MPDENLTFAIGPDSEITVRSYPELIRWLDNERAKWSWLNPGDPDANRHNTAANVQGAWDNLYAAVTSEHNHGHALSEARAHLQNLVGGHILVSTTPDGAMVLDVLRSTSVRSAAFAAGFVTQQIGASAAQSREDFLGALLAVMPDLRGPIDASEHLKRERANFRNATRNLIERVDREAEDRQREQRDLLQRVSGIGRRIFDLKREQWRAAQSEWQDGATTAVDAIKTTDATYNQFMQLKAPVKYWEDKAVEHGKKERSARIALYTYFPVTVVTLGVVFWCTGAFMVNNSTGENALPPAAYVILSGGLLLLSTMVFWIGRLLTKLYLSEHHLRNDAEERAVMAETYLAMTNGGAADEKDRHIVLSALFRNTPDGIIKDDGPTDASLQGFLAKLAVR